MEICLVFEIRENKEKKLIAMLKNKKKMENWLSLFGNENKPYELWLSYTLQSSWNYNENRWKRN